MISIYKALNGRKIWKNKALGRGKEVRYLKKENARIKKDRDKYKAEVRKLKKELEKERQHNNTPIHNKQELVYVVLNLFLVGRISFRAVPRVLDVLSGYLGLPKVPSTQTVINWVIRLSITKMHNPAYLNSSSIDKSNFSNGLIWIIDISIGLGSGKIFTILGLNFKHHDLNEGAPTLKDVHCVAVAVADSWTGEDIADFLQRVIAVTGRPAAYLKDGGSDLAKGVRITGERGLGSISIDDISHIVANFFKHEYQNHPMFNIFISLCGKVSTNLKQTVLAFLAPPKVSTKSRFMNLQRLIIWADQLLNHSPVGRVAKDSILSKLRASMDEMPQCKPFIKCFLRDAKVMFECQKIIKTEGLSKDTYNRCKIVLEDIPVRSGIRIGFTTWLDQHLQVAQKLNLENSGLPSASDILESLYGISKQHGTGNIKDADRIALRMPALCGEITLSDAERVLEITVKEQQDVEAAINSLTKQRRRILPNPGSLNDDIIDGIQHLELIPESKKRVKKSIKVDISESYKKQAGQNFTSQKKETIPYMPDFQRALSG